METDEINYGIARYKNNVLALKKWNGKEYDACNLVSNSSEKLYVCIYKDVYIHIDIYVYICIHVYLSI